MPALDSVKKRNDMPGNHHLPPGWQAFGFGRRQVDGKHDHSSLHSLGGQKPDAPRLDHAAKGGGRACDARPVPFQDLNAVIGDKGAAVGHQLQRQRGFSRS